MIERSKGAAGGDITEMENSGHIPPRALPSNAYYDAKVTRNPESDMAN